YNDLILGGAGAIITSFANIMKDDQPTQYMLGIYDDSFIEDYKKITDFAKFNNCKMILQIVYGGNQTMYNLANRTILAPSSVENIYSKFTPKSASKEELKNIINSFAHSALRAKKSGFDGIQIHGAHGYFLSQFLNPYYNRRDDEYGGNLENRARIIFEVYDEIRKKVGDEYFISIKINCEDFMVGGATLEDNIYVCQKLSQMGIDLIEISGGSASSEIGKGAIRMIKNENDESYFYEQAKQIAKSLSAPIVLVGGHKNIEKMESIINNSKIEFLSLSRPLVSEPDLPNRWKIDKTSARCISCNRCFLNKKRCVLL
ncbi:MAG: NADH:flavin oxidoreductase, partial [Fusobacteriaceae bacterium]